MVDWTASMQQTFEHYLVDPKTWGNVKMLDDVISCTINRDSSAETLGSATIDISEPIGESYVRSYLVTIQNGIKEKHPLGTHLVQTPSYGFDGKIKNVAIDTYTPLLELKENMPPLGYYIPKTANIMDMAYSLTRNYVRAPVVRPTCDITLQRDFVSNTSDTWLTFLIDLIANAKYEYMLDEFGRILFAPKQDTASLQPVWTYDDSNSSILYPTLDFEQDLYGIPNVVEVIYSDSDVSYEVTAVNDDPNSPISTVNRGRRITVRDTDPAIVGNVSEEQVREYANNQLRELSTLEYKVTYKHAYCPVRLGDCVRLNYKKAGINGIKAKVISQSITCEPGCPVSETAVFINKLWR